MPPPENPALPECTRDRTPCLAEGADRAADRGAGGRGQDHPSGEYEQQCRVDVRDKTRKCVAHRRQTHRRHYSAKILIFTSSCFESMSTDTSFNWSMSSLRFSGLISEMSKVTPFLCSSSFTRSWALVGIKLASLTPARSNAIGTRTLMCTGDFFQSLVLSMITRRNLGVGLV